MKKIQLLSSIALILLLASCQQEGETIYGIWKIYEIKSEQYVNYKLTDSKTINYEKDSSDVELHIIIEYNDTIYGYRNHEQQSAIKYELTDNWLTCILDNDTIIPLQISALRYERMSLEVSKVDKDDRNKKKIVKYRLKR